MEYKSNVEKIFNFSSQEISIIYTYAYYQSNIFKSKKNSINAPPNYNKLREALKILGIEEVYQITALTPDNTANNNTKKNNGYTIQFSLEAKTKIDQILDKEKNLLELKNQVKELFNFPLTWLSTNSHQNKLSELPLDFDEEKQRLQALGRAVDKAITHHIIKDLIQNQIDLLTGENNPLSISRHVCPIRWTTTIPMANNKKLKKNKKSSSSQKNLQSRPLNASSVFINTKYRPSSFLEHYLPDLSQLKDKCEVIAKGSSFLSDCESKPSSVDLTPSPFVSPLFNSENNFASAYAPPPNSSKKLTSPEIFSTSLNYYSPLVFHPSSSQPYSSSYSSTSTLNTTNADLDKSPKNQFFQRLSELFSKINSIEFGGKVFSIDNDICKKLDFPINSNPKEDRYQALKHSFNQMNEFEEVLQLLKNQIELLDLLKEQENNPTTPLFDEIFVLKNPIDEKLCIKQWTTLHSRNGYRDAIGFPLMGEHRDNYHQELKKLLEEFTSTNNKQLTC